MPRAPDVAYPDAVRFLASFIGVVAVGGPGGSDVMSPLRLENVVECAPSLWAIRSERRDRRQPNGELIDVLGVLEVERASVLFRERRKSGDRPVVEGDVVTGGEHAIDGLATAFSDVGAVEGGGDQSGGRLSVIGVEPFAGAEPLTVIRPFSVT